MCVSVRPFGANFLKEKYTTIDILYTNRRGIYLERFITRLEIRPTNRPDAIVRKVDAGRKKHSKMTYFSRFSDTFAYFPISYRLKILNEGKW